MRVSNLYHFTENHRCCTFRDFSLSSMDYRMLSHIYQPIVGPFAIALYQLFYQQIPAEQTGYSPIEQQRRLFLLSDLEMNEAGRKYWMEMTSKLEAMSLLQTSRIYIPDTDDYLYEYELQAPLTPNEFFKNQHFTLLLRDKIGKITVLRLREEFCAKEPDELLNGSANKENISVPFYELFRLNSKVIDYELEQALAEVAPTRKFEETRFDAGDAEQDKAANIGALHYADIIRRFPKQSINRAFVEALRYKKDEVAVLNHIVRKYDLSLTDLCRLLDEEGVFDERGLLEDVLQYRANLHYRQSKKRSDDNERYIKKSSNRAQAEGSEQKSEQTVEMEFYLDVPAKLQAEYNVHEYNRLLRNSSYTLVIKKFFDGSVPDYVLNIFEKVDLNYKLKEEVINVLIHYLIVYKKSLTAPFVESVVSDMLGKQVTSYELAVQYIRDYLKYKERQQKQADKPTAGSGTSTYRGRGRPAKQKPNIPIIADSPNDKTVTPEQLEAMLEKARKLNGK